ncbi:hypothetical protein Rt10032_c09g3904 [Rhodotorula toruloides]|uniref:Proteophosphoglycan 5 n=1 Tax=Rhodotorula toruloides TaxID=5286 RepID=A0A511KHP4_RHOTO|nr:hypothetical protein Rt10032_c09g3904 [Rhodotorula toruloides]
MSVLENLSAAAVSSPPLFTAITSLLPTILSRSTTHNPLTSTAVLAAVRVLKPRLSQMCAAAEPAVLLEDVAYLVVCLDRMLSHLLMLVGLSDSAAAKLKVDQPKTSRSSGTGSAWFDARHSRLIGSSFVEASEGYALSSWSGGSNKRVASGGRAELVSGLSLLAALEQVVERLSVPSASAAALAHNRVTRASFLPTHVPGSVADLCALVFLFATERDCQPSGIAEAAATALRTARPCLVSQAGLDKSAALSRHLDAACALLASHISSPVDIARGSDVWRIVQAMRALWGKSSSVTKIHRLASADQLEAFAMLFGRARLGHLPHGSLSFSPQRLHVKVLRLDLAPAHLVRTILAAAPSDALPQTPPANDSPDATPSHPSRLPSLSVSAFLRLAGETEHVDKLYAGLSLPPTRVPADAAASLSSTWFDQTGDLINTAIGRRRLTYPPFIPEPPIPSLPTLPLLHPKSPLLPTVRQKLRLNPDGTGELSKGTIFLFLDLGLKNPVAMWVERAGNPSETKAILLRNATFLETQRREARDGRERSPFDLKRLRDRLHSQAAHQLVAAAGLAPAHAKLSPLAPSATPALSSASHSSSLTPTNSSSAPTSASSARINSSSAPVDSRSSSTGALSRQTVVVAIGAGAIESSSGQRGPRAAGPVACKFVEQLSARDDLDVLAFAIDKAWTSRCVCLDCRLKDNRPLVKF